VAVSYGPVFATAYDATGGMLALEVPKPGVAYAPVVDLVESPDVLADALDLPWTRSFRHGFCWGLLVPDGSRLVVVVMGREGPDLAGDGVVAGRLSDEDVARWAPLWSGRAVRVSVLVEATPGLFDLEVRFRTNAATDSVTTVLDLGPRAGETPAPAAGRVAVPPTEASTEVAPYADTAPSLGVAAEAVAGFAPDPVTHVDAAWPVEEGLAAALGAVAAAPAAPAVDPNPESVTPAPGSTLLAPGVGGGSAAPEDTVLEPAAAVVPAVIDVPPEPGDVAPEPSPALDLSPATVPDEPAPEAVETAPVAPVPEPAPVLDLARLVPPSAPAAWYADPSDDASWRWWDGSRWTTDAAPRPGSRDGSGPS
jgi:hypothetical protein